MSRRWQVIITATVLGGLLVVAVTFMVQAWARFDAELSIHGWIALILGVVVSLVIGLGLMALVFFSARRGYDDGVGLDDERDGR